MHACTVVLINVSNVCCLQDVGAPITPREEVIIALYDVARPENMSPAFIDTDDAPPPGYDVVCKENMPSPEYETVPLALAGKPTFTSENPPPLPPPMIRGDSEAPDLPPPYNPAVDNERVVDLLVETIQCVESSISQSLENQSVDIDGEVDELVKRDQSVRDESLDNCGMLKEEVTSSTEAQPNEREVNQSVPEGEVVEAKDATQGFKVVPLELEEVGGWEERIAAQVRSTEV